MNKKNLVAAATLAATTLCAASFNAHAQAGAAPAAAASAPALPSTPAKKALVQRFLAVQQGGIDSLAHTLAEQPLGEMRQPVLEALQTRVPADQRDATLKAIDSDFRKYLDDAVPVIRDKAAQLAPSTLGAALEARMTEDELKQLVTFFESPANKKYAQVAPEAQNALIQKLIAETRPSIEPKIRAVQQAVGARLSAFSAPAAAPAGSAPAK